MELVDRYSATVSAKTTAKLHWAITLGVFLNNPFSSSGALALYVVIASLLIISCLLTVVETIPRYNPEVFPELESTWNIIEIVLSSAFVLELAVRFVAAALEPTERGVGC